MAKIEHVEISLVNLPPKVLREDATQTFELQETPIVTITDSDGAQGTGYSYTIGTGGHSVVALLEKTLAPALIGRDPARITGLWHDLLRRTNATSVGAITSLALAAIDTALWDLACRKANLPLWKAAGGARDHIPVYSTEGGWLNLETSQLVEDAVEKKRQGFRGCKIKIGRPLHEDAARLAAMRQAVGDDFEIMVDANQSFSLSEALRRTSVLEDHGVGWFEEPLRADNVHAHATLARSTRVPVAVGESMYSLSQFNEYLAADAASIIQVDVARIGGITPWLKVAALAEAHGVTVCPHFLMELHLSLVCAIPNAQWLEHIPQLDLITTGEVAIVDGIARPPETPGIGIDWNPEAIAARSELTLHIGKANT
ncbi:mandelate racemase/muconate lactonizing enzyme family protein [Oceaniglobus trochenteri]|uniref:mandelate racemase/muconate lactonizing enzyme family protein n=1 Tax=Oceaniglobus trochenteri TaxID=2763260 RepID=UPI001CFFC4B0|nr:mandelate racemase/muconate lactonizing enzyme family protein [Oceaniglobus trochenteri]